VGKDHDVFASSSRRLAVVDGATPLSEGVEDVRRYAEALAHGLVDEAGDDERAALAASITLASSTFESGRCPSAGVSWVSVHAGSLVVGALGDCVWAVLTRDGDVVESRSHDLEALDGRAIGHYTAALDRGLTPAEADAEIAPMLAEHRSLLNTEHGYWAARAEPAAAQRARLSAFDDSGVAVVLLLSDGASRLYDTFHVVQSVRELATTIAADPLSAQELLGSLRAEEALDVERRAHPRLGAHDDATLAWLVGPDPLGVR
jgi:hypothetical protein